MAVKKGNTRIQVTMSEKQANWIRDNAKKLGMNPSRFIKFLIDKNIGKFMNMLPPEKLDELIRIAKTPWLDFDDDDDDFIF